MDELDKAEKLITIENLQRFTVVYERKRGNYHNLPKEWCLFVDKYEYLAAPDTLYIECTIDDPSITDENNCMYELCQTISPSHPALKENTDILTHDYDGIIAKKNFRAIISNYYDAFDGLKDAITKFYDGSLSSIDSLD